MEENIMKRSVRITFIIVGGFIGLCVIAALGYRVMFSQRAAASFEVNTPNLETKVLIATQGSNFKEALVSGIIEELKLKPVYMKVIDVTGLPDIEEEEWHVVVVLSACESNALPSQTQTYLQQATLLDKHVVIITSGSGHWKPERASFDSISTASKTANVDQLVARIIERITMILERSS
jgi:hypothetical protein